MITSPLLRNARHGVMITLVCPLRTKVAQPVGYSHFTLQLRASKDFGSGSKIKKLLAPAPEQFGPKS